MKFTPASPDRATCAWDLPPRQRHVAAGAAGTRHGERIAGTDRRRLSHRLHARKRRRLPSAVHLPGGTRQRRQRQRVSSACSCCQTRSVTRTVPPVARSPANSRRSACRSTASSTTAPSQATDQAHDPATCEPSEWRLAHASTVTRDSRPGVYVGKARAYSQAAPRSRARPRFSQSPGSERVRTVAPDARPGRHASVPAARTPTFANRHGNEHVLIQMLQAVAATGLRLA